MCLIALVTEKIPAKPGSLDQQAIPGKTRMTQAVSEKTGVADPADNRVYLKRAKPAFIINCAIAAIDSDPQLAYEINYQGTVYLAKAAQELGIPYIHLSSAAVMPIGLNLQEEERLPLQP